MGKEGWIGKEDVRKKKKKKQSDPFTLSLSLPPSLTSQRLETTITAFSGTTNDQSDSQTTRLIKGLTVFSLNFSFFILLAHSRFHSPLVISSLFHFALSFDTHHSLHSSYSLLFPSPSPFPSPSHPIIRTAHSPSLFSQHKKTSYFLGCWVQTPFLVFDKQSPLHCQLDSTTISTLPRCIQKRKTSTLCLSTLLNLGDPIFNLLSHFSSEKQHHLIHFLVQGNSQQTNKHTTQLRNVSADGRDSQCAVIRQHPDHGRCRGHPWLCRYEPAFRTLLRQAGLVCRSGPSLRAPRLLLVRNNQQNISRKTRKQPMIIMLFLTHHFASIFYLFFAFFFAIKNTLTYIHVYNFYQKNSLGLGCMRYYSIILEDLAFKHSLRIYCIDRPGVGMSHASDPDLYKVLFFLNVYFLEHLNRQPKISISFG